MSHEAGKTDPQLFSRWVRHTFFGWVLGFVVVIALAVAWDVVGGGAQFMIGVGMGTGVGFAQGRLAKEWLGSARRWAVASIVGLGAPFVLGDVIAAVGIQVPYSLALYVVLGGLLVGLLQRRLLRSHFDHVNWWVPASIVGWSLPAGAIAVGDSIAAAWGGVLSVSAMLLGGVLLGLVTGGTLVRMSSAPRDLGSGGA